MPNVKKNDNSVPDTKYAINKVSKQRKTQK